MNRYISSYARTFTNPAVLFREIGDDYSAPSLLLVVLLGLTAGLNNYLPSFAALGNVLSAGSNGLMMIMMVFLPVVGTLIWIILYTGLLNWMSTLFKGVSTDPYTASTPLRLALPFTYLPTIVALILALFFDAGRNEMTLHIAGWLWSYGLIIVMVAAIKRLSYPRAALVVILSWLLVMLPVMLVYFSYVMAGGKYGINF